jgi:hypothetical protein
MAAGGETRGLPQPIESVAFAVYSRIRAQVVDKDRNPKWCPASLAAVNADDVEAFFAPVDDDLNF